MSSQFKDIGRSTEPFFSEDALTSFCVTLPLPDLNFHLILADVAPVGRTLKPAV
jgi:hypothetical protein